MGGAPIAVPSASIPGKAEQMGVQEATDADGLGWGGEFEAWPL